MNYYLLFFLALIIFSSFSIFFNLIAKQCGLIDYPNERKKHKGSIPLTGGIVIYSTIFFLLRFFPLDTDLNIILYVSFVIILIGALDDSIQLNVLIRLFTQIFCTLILLGAGFIIKDIGEYDFYGHFYLGKFSIVFTVICVVSLTNAMNFIDGTDGLSSGLFLTSILFLIFYSYNEISIVSFNFLIIIIIPLIFFMFLNINFNISFLNKIFLGDSGSTFLGFTLAFLSIYFTQIERLLHPVLIPWIISIPIFDLITVTLKRFINKNNPFNADRSHLHHILADCGFSNLITLLIIIFFSILGSVVGGLIFFFWGADFALFLLLIWLLLFIVMNIFFTSRKKQNIN